MGNPGASYAGTRHNVGFAVVDALVRKTGIPLRKPLFRPYEYGRGMVEGDTLTVARPLTFMNRTGEVVPALLRRARAEPGRMVVACDTLDLPPGTLRLKRKGSTAGHRGLASIVGALGTGAFPRLYVGIGHPSGHTTGPLPDAAGTENSTADRGRGKRQEVIEYVLGKPSEEEREQLEAAVGRGADAILRLLSQPIEEVMNAVNSPQP